MHRRPQFEPLARLAAAGCGLFGSFVSRWDRLFSRTKVFRPFVLRWCVCPAVRCCGGFGRRGAFGSAAPLEFGVGAWPSSRVGALILMGAAAAALAAGALLGRLCRLGFGWVHGALSRVGAFIPPNAGYRAPTARTRQRRAAQAAQTAVGDAQ